MGPRSADRGIIEPWIAIANPLQLLQWGRDQLIAELSFERELQRIGLVASMGPRSADRGI